MHVVIVAAHPDDEILGLGVLLPQLPLPYAIIHITDGAPRSGDDVRNAGCKVWQEYAALRRREFEQAIAAAGGSQCVALCLDCPDQQAVLRIAEHAMQLVAILDALRPSVVFTHAYEGGHPDHDATAAAVHAALRIRKTPCALAEFAGYHAGAAGMECECFLRGGADAVQRTLTPEQSRWKRGLLDCYSSQAHVLSQFPLRHEPLRLASPYDFSRPPHEGPLYYDGFDWGVDSAGWRSLAGRAFRNLGIPCMC
jgi:LmbE family N-acetylglucosaminyl deacetylase